MTANPRILHLLDHSVPLQSGYAVRSHAIMQQQRLAGYDVAALTSPRHGVDPLQQEEIDGFLFFRSTTPYRASSWWQAGATIYVTFRRLSQVIRHWRPHIIHAHSPFLMGVVAIAVGKRHGIPVVYEIRAFWEDAAVCHGTALKNGLRYRLTRSIETLVMRQAHGVITLCQGLRQDILQRGISSDKVVITGNGTEGTLARPSSLFEPNQTGTPPTMLGYIGSMYSYEGLATLLRALPLIQRRFPVTRITLVGDGPELGALRHLAFELGLADSILFTGSLPKAQACALYQGMDICVFPRLSSRLTELVTPLKPLEAMAHHRLVIASDVGGHRELIRHQQTGLLFPPGDEKALASLVLQILEQPLLYRQIIAAAMSYVLEERSWLKQCESTHGLYRTLLGQQADCS